MCTYGVRKSEEWRERWSGPGMIEYGEEEGRERGSRECVEMGRFLVLLEDKDENSRTTLMLSRPREYATKNNKMVYVTNSGKGEGAGRGDSRIGMQLGQKKGCYFYIRYLQICMIFPPELLRKCIHTSIHTYIQVLNAVQ